MVRILIIGLIVFFVVVALLSIAWGSVSISSRVLSGMVAVL